MNCQRLRRERQKTIERKESYQTLTAPGASSWMALGRTWTRVKGKKSQMGKKRVKKGNEGRRRGATAMRRQCELSEVDA
jgi:hypothetical protein